MAHQQDAGASDAPVSHSVDSAAAALSETFQTAEDDLIEDDAEDEELPEDSEDEEEYEGEEGDEEDDEQEVPAIDAPVSLTADEKAAFSQLPSEAQEFVSSLEQRRNTQVQEATTKASDAQRKAEQAAASAQSQAEARYAEQLKQFTAHFAPQMPDPSQFQDIGTYQRAKAQYDYAKAQHDEVMQQVAQIGVETDEQKAERIQKRDAELLKIPEVANVETRDAYISGALNVAAELGYDRADLAANMEASDLKALGTAAKWKADSEELAKIKAKSKERRRDVKTGKFRSLKPGSAQQQRSGKQAQKKAQQRLVKTGSVDDAAVALKALLTEQ